MRAHMHVRGCVLGKGPSLPPGGPGQVKLSWASHLHHFVVTFGTYLPP